MNYSKQDCIDALRVAAKEYTSDLTVGQYRESDLSPSDRTIVKRFGSWNEAKRAAGLNTNHVGVTLENKRSPVPERTDDRGYERWDVNDLGERYTVTVHRLLAVAEFGLDAVVGKDVHHINELSWDNRPENIELIDHAEHASMHRSTGKWHSA